MAITAVLLAGLTQERLSFAGAHYQYRDVPIELHPLPLAKVAASGLASFRSWLAATQYFNPHERRFGSIATEASGFSAPLCLH